MAELSPNTQVIRWEFSFESNEFERHQAVRAFGSEGKSGGLRRWMVPLIAWSMYVAVLLAIFWAASWVSVLFHYVLHPYVSPDLLTVGPYLMPAILAVLILVWTRSFFSRRAYSKRSVPIQGLVRIHEDGEVSFLSAGTTVRRAIERVVLSDAFVFLCIEEGKRFVFVPRTMVASDEAAAIAEFVSRRIAART
jgi:hypothetical protein